MDKTRIWTTAGRIAGLAVCAALAVSCVQEADDIPADGGVVAGGRSTVTLSIGAADGVEKREYGNDENAMAGEFMNSLAVFIVDNNSGAVEKKIMATDSAAFRQSLTTAGSGCVTEYKTTVTLSNGPKTIYAFSNLEGHALVGGQADGLSARLVAINEGGQWEDSGVAGAELDDPAGKLNFRLGTPDARVFIPMTAVRQVSVPVSGGVIDVELVRLVGKVRPVLTNDQSQEVTVSTLRMGNFADRVPLFEGGTPTGVQYDRTLSYDGLSVTVPADGSAPLYGTDGLPAELYVNETAGTQPFTIALTIDGDVMSGQTVTTEIPRNHILPLALSLSDFRLTVEAYVAPIGAYPVLVRVDGPTLTNNIYTVGLPEGCTFTVNGGWVRADGTETAVAAWSWQLPDGASAGVVIDGGPTAIPLAGHLTALPGQTFALDFAVTRPRAKTGRLEITTYPLDEVEFQSSARRYNWWAAPAEYELVNLVGK